eukprot:9278519-Lingulodinium_polyedra.AAC.1
MARRSVARRAMPCTKAPFVVAPMYQFLIFVQVRLNVGSAFHVVFRVPSHVAFCVAFCVPRCASRRV